MDNVPLVSWQPVRCTSSYELWYGSLDSGETDSGDKTEEYSLDCSVPDFSEGLDHNDEDEEMIVTILQPLSYWRHISSYLNLDGPFLHTQSLKSIRSNKETNYHIF